MYILREYTITEYEIDAETKKEAEEKFDKGEYKQFSEWLEKYEIVKKYKKRKEKKITLEQAKKMGWIK